MSLCNEVGSVSKIASDYFSNGFEEYNNYCWKLASFLIWNRFNQKVLPTAFDSSSIDFLYRYSEIHLAGKLLEVQA